MSKKNFFFVILASTALPLLLNIFIGRFLAAKISTLPALNRWKIISPETPIVINQQQVVRVSDAGDMISAVQAVQPKISSIIELAGKEAIVSGAAVNMTSDGYFIASAKSFPQPAGKTAQYYVKLEDGSLRKVDSFVYDSATSLVIVKASFAQVPAAGFADSTSLAPGQKLAVVSLGLADHAPSFFQGFVASQETGGFGTLDADLRQRTFAVQVSPAPPAPAVLVDPDGNVAGLLGDGVTPADVIKNLFNNFLVHDKQLIRPAFGFSYRNLSAAEAQVLGEPAGAMAVDVRASQPAQKAGLAAGDIITAVAGESLSVQNPLENILQKYQPGDTMTLSVVRGKDTLSLKLTAGKLQ